MKTLEYSYPIARTTIGPEERAAMVECITQSQTTMSNRVREFETRFAEYVGTPEAVMVNSGASANLLCMLAARECKMLQPGDEVLVPAVTWPTQVSAVIEAGFIPRFMDVDIHTLQVSPETIEKSITPRTRAISLVHLAGSPCDMGAIVKLAATHNLHLFEDCCEALGAQFNQQRVGSFGLASAFSFFQSHHICTMEGGMITSWHRGFSEAVRGLRAHGWTRDLKYHKTLDPKAERFNFVSSGFNFRPLELSGACGLVQLGKLEQFNKQRFANYCKLADTGMRKYGDNPCEPLSLTHLDKSKPSWMMVPFVLKPGLDRASACAFLEAHGIETRPLVGGNLLRQPAFSDYWTKHLPGADAIHERGFYIGLSPFEEDLTPVVQALNRLAEKLLGQIQ